MLSSNKDLSGSHSVGTAGVGFKLTSDGNYDMDTKRLTNLDEGVNSNDAITKHQREVGLSTKLNKNIDNNLDLQEKYVIESK